MLFIIRLTTGKRLIDGEKLQLPRKLTGKNINNKT